jgi:hypothetical protein
VQGAVQRADAVRQRTAGHDRTAATLRGRLGHLGRHFLDRLGPEFETGLDEFERQVREARLDAAQLQHLFGAVCADLEAEGGLGGDNAEKRLRPLLLELMMRLVGGG